MAKQHGRPQDIGYEWPLFGAALNRQVSGMRLRPGEMRTCAGVDGRFFGGLRPFPGMTLLKATSLADVVGMWYVTLQRGASSSDLLRGFLLKYKFAAGDYRLAYHYYDENSSAWASYALTGITMTETISVSVGGPLRFCYIAIDGQDALTMYYDSGMTHETMGVGTLYVESNTARLIWPTLGAFGGNGTGYLMGNQYDCAYRYYDSTRGRYSAMSTYRRINGADYDDGGSNKVITNPDADPDQPYDDGYRILQVFRTLGSATPAGAPAGLMYLEGEFTLTANADCWPTVTVGNLSDDALVWQEVDYPGFNDVGMPPDSGALAYLEGITFMGSDTTGGSADTQLRWSPAHYKSAEAFPPTSCTFGWDAADGEVIRFCRAGDMLFAFTEGAVYRIAKNGSQLMFTRMHSGRSIVSRLACHELGRDILGVTDLGVGMFDGVDGTLRVIGALNGIILDDWAGDYADIFTVSDSTCGASFILNGDDDEAAVIWHGTGAISYLEDMNFEAACSGPHPEDGGRSRAFFIDDAGKIYYPDTDAVGYYSMRGHNPATVSVNGTATSSPAVNQIADTGASGWNSSNLHGSQIYVWDQDDEEAGPQVRTISGAAATTLTVSVNFDPQPAEDDRYTIAPIPFRMVGWPMPVTVGGTGGAQDFGRRVVRTMGVRVHDLTGVAGHTNDQWRLGVCRNLEDAPPASGLQLVTMDENASDQFVRVNRDGHSIEPYVELVAAGVGFELLSVAIDATITTSRKTE